MLEDPPPVAVARPDPEADDIEDMRQGIGWAGNAAIFGTTALLIAAIVWLYLSDG